MRTRWKNAPSRPLVAGVAILALGLVAVPARASHRVKQTLSATDTDQDARGRAQLVLQTDEDGKFDVIAKKLDPDHTFDVIVNGVKVGTLTTTGGGSGRARFRTSPRSNDDQLLGFDPRGATVVVRNATGEDVLTGTVPDDTDPNEVACCLTGDHGGETEVECEDRTADECAAEGGTVAASASCIPNPCPGAPPPAEGVICCIPDQGADDTGVECEDRTSDECAAQGGTVVTATSCDPNPCTPTAPAPEIVCCVPHGNPAEGLECETLTAQRCTDRGGTQSTATSCNPDPCQP